MKKETDSLKRKKTNHKKAKRNTVLTDEDEIRSSDKENAEQSNQDKTKATEVRRKIEDYLEKRNFIKDLGEEFVNEEDLDWVSE